MTNAPVQINVKFTGGADLELMEKVLKIIEAKGMTMTALIRILLRAWVEENKQYLKK